MSHTNPIHIVPVSINTSISASLGSYATRDTRPYVREATNFGRFYPKMNVFMLKGPMLHAIPMQLVPFSMNTSSHK